MAVFEVVLPIPNSDGFWRRGGGSDLLEAHQGRLSSGRWFQVVHPRDHLLAWLRDNTPSWSYYHEVVPPRGIGYYHAVDPIGVVFGFEDASDAVLFKLTWV